MRAMTGDDPPQVVPAGQPWDTTTLLRNRAFDAWTHEQDVRRAVGRPGNLDDPGARLAQLVLTGVQPYLVAKRAGAGPGQSVRLVVDGAVGRRTSVSAAAASTLTTRPSPSPTTIRWRPASSRPWRSHPERGH